MTRILTKIPPHVSFRLRYLFQDKGVRGKELLKLYPEYSGTSLYRHAVKSIDSIQIFDKRKFNKGTPKKVSLREERIILREIRNLREEFGSFAIKRLRLVSGIVDKACDETVRNLLKSEGYKFLISRKKGLLKPKDLKERLKSSRKIKRIFKKNIWTEGMSFYLDGVGYQQKYNPVDEAKSVKSMTWRQRSEDLEPLCTAKGSHTGNGGRMTHFIVAISFNKGVISFGQYFGKISEEMFADFIHKHFKQAFKKSNNP